MTEPLYRKRESDDQRSLQMRRALEAYDQALEQFESHPRALLAAIQEYNRKEGLN